MSSLKRKHSAVSDDTNPASKSSPGSQQGPLSGHDRIIMDDQSSVGTASSLLCYTSESPISELSELLDFSGVSSNKDMLERFNRISDLLLLEQHLTVSAREVQTSYELLEIEFYMQYKGLHEDPFTHGSEEQKQSGQWYFHRAPRRSPSSAVPGKSVAGYRGGTRKGLDLTIGTPLIRTSRYFSSGSNDSSKRSKISPHGAIRGGVLLRSIRRIPDGVVISGPSLLVDEILRISKAASIIDLVNEKWGGDISAMANNTAESKAAGTRLQLEPRSKDIQTKRPEIYRSPRIGLDLSHSSIPATDSLTHPRVIFVSKPYRYFTHPHLLTANGRGQTFLGVYQSCVDRGLADGDIRLREEIARIAGVKAGMVEKLLDEYRLGRTKGTLKPFIGSAGKGASVSAASFLKMMGVLRTLTEKSDA